MLLNAKHALVFTATGVIGSGVARRFAQEGATVWISGRHPDALEELEAAIRAAGGTAHAEVVDATDPEAVDAYIGRVAEAAGKLDVVFNAIGGRPVDLGYPQPSTTQDLAAFMLPLQIVLGSQFLTSRAAASHMARTGGGAVVTLSATLSGMTAPFMAGISAACGAVEAMTRSLAGEFVRAGVRVNCVRGSGMPETRTIQETGAGLVALTGELPSMALPPLGRLISIEDTAKAAAFLASDHASGMTGQVVTVCGGVFVG